jgi:hypothetical protein
MQRVPVAAQSSHQHPARLNIGQKLAPSLRVMQQQVGVAVGGARIVARAELDRFDPQRAQSIEHP